MHVRPQLHGRAVAEVAQHLAGGVAEEVPGIDDLDVVAPLEHVPHDERRLGRVRAARRVAHEPAGRRGVERAAQQVPLERPELGEVARLASPARLGAAAKGPETGARRVDEDPPVCRRLGLTPWIVRLLFDVLLMVVPGSQLLLYPVLSFLMPADDSVVAAVATARDQ